MKINNERYSLKCIPVSDLIKSRYKHDVDIENGIPGVTLSSSGKQYFIWFNVKGANDVYVRVYNSKEFEWGEWKEIDAYDKTGRVLSDFGDFLNSIVVDL